MFFVGRKTQEFITHRKQQKNCVKIIVRVVKNFKIGQKELISWKWQNGSVFGNEKTAITLISNKTSRETNGFLIFIWTEQTNF